MSTNEAGRGETYRPPALDPLKALQEDIARRFARSQAQQGEARQGETHQSRLAWNYEPNLPELKLQEWKRWESKWAEDGTRMMNKVVLMFYIWNSLSPGALSSGHLRRVQ